MVTICEDFAHEYNLTFNSKKSFLIAYNVPVACEVKLTLNGQSIHRTDFCVHLGTYIGSNKDSLNIEKSIRDKCYHSVLLSCFSHCATDVSKTLFQTFVCIFMLASLEVEQS